MHPKWTLFLPAEASVASNGADALAIGYAGRRLMLRHLPPAVRAGLEQLAYPGTTLERLAARLPGFAVADVCALFVHHAQWLRFRGVLRAGVQTGDQRLATLEPTSAWFAPVREVDDTYQYVLSRFAYLRRAGAELVLETPRCAARVILHDPRVAALIRALATPATGAGLRQRVPEFPADALPPVIALLCSAEILSPVGADGAIAEDEHPQLRSWEFHDLLYHARSREGRHDAPVGNTYRMAGILPPPPPLKPVHAATTIPLLQPDPNELAARDPPFAQVMERRRSVREYGAVPLTAAQLGEFLYSVAAVRDRLQYDAYTPAGVIPLDATVRTYPSGGAFYPLEIYPVVQACAGLDSGLYHYDPGGHRLERLTPDQRFVQGLIEHAAAAAGLSGSAVQILLVITARFQRVAWKYESLAYSLILKDLGGLMQSMYLAATAMGLAPCALGAGDSDLFAQAAGIDYYAEGSVGEFLLGSRAG